MLESLDIQGFQHGTPEGIRTPDLLVRSQALYPTELPARLPAQEVYHSLFKKASTFLKRVVVCFRWFLCVSSRPNEARPKFETHKKILAISVKAWYDMRENSRKQHEKGKAHARRQ